MRRAALGIAIVTVAASAVFVAPAPAKPAGPGPGNSPNAKLCQKGGWEDVVRSDGSAFASQGECVSYGARGGSLLPANHAPEAADDSGSVKEDTAPNPVSGNVLTNDSDPDGNTLAVTSFGTFVLAHGRLVLNPDGSYSYTLDNSDPAVNALNDGQTLTETFTYSIADGHGGTDTAKLRITINGTTD